MFLFTKKCCDEDLLVSDMDQILAICGRVLLVKLQYKVTIS